MKTNLENYEERFVDYMEGQLSAEEMCEVEAFVAEHPELEDDFKLFCSAKLEPDTTVVFTKKESLTQPTTVIRPLFVRIAAAAACVALLIGIGVHFLKPSQELERQPMLAALTPIEAQPLHVAHNPQNLRKSLVKSMPIPQSVAEPQEEEEVYETMAPYGMVASMAPIAPKPLHWDGHYEVFDIETTMYIELGERLALVGPLSEPNVMATLRGVFFSDVRQTTRTLYKRTAKTVMDIYYTADYRINEAKNNIGDRLADASLQ